MFASAISFWGRANFESNVAAEIVASANGEPPLGFLKTPLTTSLMYWPLGTWIRTFEPVAGVGGSLGIGGASGVQVRPPVCCTHESVA